jgi:hypothetical protein
MSTSGWKSFWAMVACFVLLTLLMAMPAAAQWHRDRGEHRGWDRHRHWEHRRPPPQPQGIDFGAIIGGIAGAFATRPSPDAVAYCMQRYRSYNPELGVYYGYDGQPRRCP